MSDLKQKITEDSKVHEGWYKDVKFTLKDIPLFLKALLEDYEHDYGTICHAIAAGAVQTARAMNRHEAAGITGFQASQIMWLFIRHWSGKKGPMRLVGFEQMLYPQYAKDFEKVIDQNTWEYLQAEAKKNLEGFTHLGSPKVRAHWQSIVDGKVPFGYTVEP